MAEETLIAAEGNAYDCEGCRSRPNPPDALSEGAGKIDANNRLLLVGKPPGVLLSQLKRFQARRKNNATVEFPVELNMVPCFWQHPQVRKERGGRAIRKVICSVSGWGGGLLYRERGKRGVVPRVVYS